MYLGCIFWKKRTFCIAKNTHKTKKAFFVPFCSFLHAQKPLFVLFSGVFTFGFCFCACLFLFLVWVGCYSLRTAVNGTKARRTAFMFRALHFVAFPLLFCKCLIRIDKTRLLTYPLFQTSVFRYWSALKHLVVPIFCGCVLISVFCLLVCAVGRFSGLGLLVASLRKKLLTKEKKKQKKKIRNCQIYVSAYGVFSNF